MLIQIALHQPQMLLPIITHTPAWVWGLLAALLWLGLRHCLPRSAGLRRMLLMPLAMAGLSAWGLTSAFAGGAPAGAMAAVLAIWLLATLAAAAAFLWLRPQVPQGTRFDAKAQRFHLPGSAVPMVLILGIFCTKYIVGVELALAPTLVHDNGFAHQVAALYGLFSGVFLARAARLWRLAVRGGSTLATAP